jgi:hypothetical protein
MLRSIAESMKLNVLSIAGGCGSVLVVSMCASCGSTPVEASETNVANTAHALVAPTKGQPSAPPAGTAIVAPASGYEYAAAAKWVPADTISISSRVTVGQPTVRRRIGGSSGLHSLAEMSIGNTPPATGQSSTEIAELGWVVYDDDPKPRLFVYYWTNGVGKCSLSTQAHYSCPTFVSTSSTITPDMALTVNAQIDMAITHVDSGSTAGWHFFFNGTDFGYIPDSAWGGRFTTYSVGQFFGEIAGDSVTRCSSMGTGRLASAAYSARFQTPQFTVRGQAPSDATPSMATTETDPSKWSLFVDTTFPKAVRFGGPYPSSTSSCTPLSKKGDFDGDGRADQVVWQPSNQTWFIRNSSNGATSSLAWGAAGDVIVPADYDGDGKTDVAVWDPSNQTWYIRNSSTSTGTSVQWGSSGHIPIPADYDGDGKADIAVWSNSTWYIRYSSDNSGHVVTWGSLGQVPVPADYDGDGKADIAVWQPSNGTWYITKSTGGTFSASWGSLDTKAIPGDYDGDAIADFAVWQPSTGNVYVKYSSTGATANLVGMLPEEVPVPADFDGDGYTDVAAWRQSDFTWAADYSKGDGLITVSWGSAGQLASVGAQSELGCAVDKGSAATCDAKCKNTGHPNGGYCPYSQTLGAYAGALCYCNP